MDKIIKFNISLHPTAPPHNFLCRSSSLKVSCFNNIKKSSRSNEMRSIPARDMVLDFGKHKGKMLGTLSSEYLRWMSKNLITGEFVIWGKLADDVLEDEVYADRMEWEQAERLLTGDGMVGFSGSGVAGELEETGKRFGWDYDDKVGWSKVDFRLLGTSKGGRLPRVREKQQQEEEGRNIKIRSGKGGTGGGDGREKRRERAAKRREHHTVIGRKMNTKEEETNDSNNGGKADEEEEIGLFLSRSQLQFRICQFQREYRARWSRGEDVDTGHGGAHRPVCSWRLFVEGFRGRVGLWQRRATKQLIGGASLLLCLSPLLLCLSLAPPRIPVVAGIPGRGVGFVVLRWKPSTRGLVPGTPFSLIYFVDLKRPITG
ncbi:hypothetical protein LXL04_032243 [Taraxacum kok-saghyz]